MSKAGANVVQPMTASALASIGPQATGLGLGGSAPMGIKKDSTSSLSPISKSNGTQHVVKGIQKIPIKKSPMMIPSRQNCTTQAKFRATDEEEPQTSPRKGHEA
ncbi:unnamed protein product, partial [Amoebophrya sp. A25]